MVNISHTELWEILDFRFKPVLSGKCYVNKGVLLLSAFFDKRQTLINVARGDNDTTQTEVKKITRTDATGFPVIYKF